MHVRRTILLSAEKTDAGSHSHRTRLPQLPKWLLAVLLPALLTQPAIAEPQTWYVPWAQQVDGGFDQIQILIEGPDRFDSPAMLAFFGSDEGEQWAQRFLNTIRNVSLANGPSPGNADLYFTMALYADYTQDLPRVHYQVYRDGQRIGNWDLIFVGPGPWDWEVEAGTWNWKTPIPGEPWLPADATADNHVNLIDLVFVRNRIGRGLRDGDAWFADVNRDGAVDEKDLILVRNALGTTAKSTTQTVAVSKNTAGSFTFQSTSTAGSFTMQSTSVAGDTINPPRIAPRPDSPVFQKIHGEQTTETIENSRAEEEDSAVDADAASANVQDANADEDAPLPVLNSNRSIINACIALVNSPLQLKAKSAAVAILAVLSQPAAIRCTAGIQPEICQEDVE